MKKNEQQQPPVWINEQEAAAWLGVSRRGLIGMRERLNINYTYLTGNRVLMYDKACIERILNENSTHHLQQS